MRTLKNMPSLPRRSTGFAALTLSTIVLASVGGCDDNLSQPPSRKRATDGTVEPLACVPNLDGKIDSKELAAAIGVGVHYVVSPPGAQRTVDLTGKKGKDGKLGWSLSADYADDQSLVITPKLAKDQWYGSGFPADAFVTPFDAGGTIDSIGRLTDQGLLLYGLASHVEAPAEGKTLLQYQTPIELLRFPVAPGQTFVSSGQIVNGTFRGLQYAGKDTYEVTVDATGTLDLASFSFDQVHRVRTKVTVEPAVGNATTQLQVSFFAECFGEVARATSATGETNPDFTTTDSLRRLGF
jgi:hypothetical protein